MTATLCPVSPGSEPDPELVIELHELGNAVVWVAPDLRFAVVNASLPPACQAAAVEALVAFRRAMGAGR